MKYTDFYNKFKREILVSSNDIKIIFPKFDLRDLSLWQEKWLIKKIRKWFYIFSDLELNREKLFFIANNLNKPSYIALESALSYYNLIPEWVFKNISISTKRINNIESDIWNFNYKNIKNSLFWWYNIVNFWKYSFLISDLEKTILDYFYFNSELKSFNDFSSKRFNVELLKEKLDKNKLEKYLKIFSSTLLNKRIFKFLDYIYA